MIGIIVLVLAVILFFLLIIGGWMIGTYNGLVSNKEDITTQWSNIKTEYQRRADLFYNLVQGVKSFKNHEKSTFVEVVEARSGKFGSSKEQEMKKMKNLDGIFSKILLLFEQYPKLQSNEQHNKLMDEVRITEDRINIARTDYNEEVREYNVMVKTFPTVLLARSFGFKTEHFFENEASTNSAPKISLD